MSYQVIISAYFQLADHTKAQLLEKKRTCPSRSCMGSGSSAMSSANYCQFCGQRIEIIVSERVGFCYPDPLEFEKEHFGSCFLLRDHSDRPDIWLVSKRVADTTYLCEYASDFEEVVLSEIDFTAELDLYKKDELLMAVLDKANEVFGPGSAELKIGLFTDYGL